MFKSRISFSIMMVVVMLLGLAALAMAAGKLPYDRSRNIMQNAVGIAPEVAKSRCDSKTGTKGIFKTYTTTGYTDLELDVVDSTGASAKAKIYANGKQIGAGTAPFRFTNDGGSAITMLAYETYSATSHSRQSCIKRK